MAAGGAPPPNSLLLLQLSVLLMSFFFYVNNAAEEELKLPVLLSPAEPPKPHGGHHHHHHNHHHSPVYPPAKSPVAHIHPPAAKSPVGHIHPPAVHIHPPVVHVHPPVKAPVKPPVHVHPPVKAPVKPPVHVHPPVKAPVKPPVHVHPPVKAPVHPPAASPPFVRNYIAVQGVVFCKSCKYPGIDTLWGATALSGSKVKLECNNTKYRPVIQTAITDKNGYFLISPKGVTTAAFHKCKVFLLSSPPSSKCDVPTNLHYGITGATLRPATDKPPVATPDHHLIQLFSVGPFAFEPSKKYPCPK